jgi:hypothetical protein
METIKVVKNTEKPERPEILRDYFLAHAPDIDADVDVESVYSAFPELGECPSWQKDPLENSKWWIRANVLYKIRYADILLAERNKP